MAEKGHKYRHGSRNMPLLIDVSLDLPTVPEDNSIPTVTFIPATPLTPRKIAQIQSVHSHEIFSGDLAPPVAHFLPKPIRKPPRLANFKDSPPLSRGDASNSGQFSHSYYPKEPPSPIARSFQLMLAPRNVLVLVAFTSVVIFILVTVVRIVPGALLTEDLLVPPMPLSRMLRAKSSFAEIGDDTPNFHFVGDAAHGSRVVKEDKIPELRRPPRRGPKVQARSNKAAADVQATVSLVEKALPPNAPPLQKPVNFGRDHPMDDKTKRLRQKDAAVKSALFKAFSAAVEAAMKPVQASSTSVENLDEEDSLNSPVLRQFINQIAPAESDSNIPVAEEVVDLDTFEREPEAIDEGIEMVDTSPDFDGPMAGTVTESNAVIDSDDTSSAMEEQSEEDFVGPAKYDFLVLDDDPELDDVTLFETAGERDLIAEELLANDMDTPAAEEAVDDAEQVQASPVAVPTTKAEAIAVEKPNKLLPLPLRMAGKAPGSKFANPGLDGDRRVLLAQKQKGRFE